MMKKFKCWLGSVVIAAAGLFLFAGCAAKTEPVSKTEFMLDTVCYITLYDKNDPSIIEDAFKLGKEYENLFSATVEGSDVYRINEADGETVEVSEDTIELIKTSIKYGDLTNGAFDITIYPISKMWDFTGENPSVPDEADIKEALKHVNYKNISIDEEKNTVTLLDSEAMIDPGAIGKGYIADKMKEYIVSKGVKSAIINLGGNVLTIGESTEKRPFKIGIRKPFADESEMATAVEANDKSVVSSGSYERYFIENGRLYYHILDPKTGYPADGGLSGITIISDKSVDGDALSTSCFILGYDKAIELLKGIKEEKIGAIFIADDNTTINEYGME
ncbi:FAD:protein FMN transferase [Lachnospiraceae bacterium C1.1]|nr:FAD:protein FMN transferase [Lachnospiraceae bacterium C1.1]